jgi:hypothetical protein
MSLKIANIKKKAIEFIVIDESSQAERTEFDYITVDENDMKLNGDTSLDNCDSKIHKSLLAPKITSSSSSSNSDDSSYIDEHHDRSPTYSPTSLMYTPTSPMHTHTSPSYSPTPFEVFSNDRINSSIDRMEILINKTMKAYQQQMNILSEQFKEIYCSEARELEEKMKKILSYYKK